MIAPSWNHLLPEKNWRHVIRRGRCANAPTEDEQSKFLQLDPSEVRVNQDLTPHPIPWPPGVWRMRQPFRHCSCTLFFTSSTRSLHKFTLTTTFSLENFGNKKEDPYLETYRLIMFSYMSNRPNSTAFHEIKAVQGKRRTCSNNRCRGTCHLDWNNRPI